MLKSVANFENVDAIAQSLSEAGINLRWNGWSLVFLRPDPAAERSPYGSYQNGMWGFASVVDPDSTGQWNLKRWTEGLNA